MASRNGLNPKIRAPKGIGFGRALPAPFGWGNGIYPNDNGTVSIPRFTDGIFTMQVPYTIEFWTKCDIGIDDSAFWIWLNIIKSTPTTYSLGFDISSGRMGYHSTDNSFQNTGSVINLDGSKQHFVYSIDNENLCNCYYNGIFMGRVPAQITSFVPTSFDINFNSSGSKKPMDEFRFYNTALRNEEVLLNYNQGIGANPCITEFLLAWFQFEQFETLDFSDLQDGSDMRLGLRDMSNNNHHAQPNGLDTDPLSGTYVLKPF